MHQSKNAIRADRGADSGAWAEGDLAEGDGLALLEVR